MNTSWKHVEFRAFVDAFLLSELQLESTNVSRIHVYILLTKTFVCFPSGLFPQKVYG